MIEVVQSSVVLRPDIHGGINCHVTRIGTKRVLVECLERALRMHRANSVKELFIVEEGYELLQMLFNPVNLTSKPMLVLINSALSRLVNLPLGLFIHQGCDILTQQSILKVVYLMAYCELKDFLQDPLRLLC